jgi:hypothetical protein
MSDKTIIVSVSMVMAALSTLAEASNAPGGINIASVPISDSMHQAVKRAVSTKPAMDLIGRSIPSFSRGLSLDGERVEFDPRVLRVAGQSDDSTDAGVSCYSNCYSACFTACHSSRGWR